MSLCRIIGSKSMKRIYICFSLVWFSNRTGLLWEHGTVYTRLRLLSIYWVWIHCLFLQLETVKRLCNKKLHFIICFCNHPLFLPRYRTIWWEKKLNVILVTSVFKIKLIIWKSLFCVGYYISLPSLLRLTQMASACTISSAVSSE